MNNESEQMVPLREYAALFKRCEALTTENSRLRDRLRHERNENRLMRSMAWDIVYAHDAECGTEGCHGCR